MVQLTTLTLELGNDEAKCAQEIERIASYISKACDGESTLLVAAALLTLMKAAASTLEIEVGQSLLTHIAADLNNCAGLLATPGDLVH